MATHHVTIEFDVEADNEPHEIEDDVQSGIDDMAVSLVSAGRVDELSNVTVEVD